LSFCNADLILEFQEKNEVKNGSKKIGIYNRELDRITSWLCPFCKGTWEENKEIGKLVMFKKERKRFSETKADEKEIFKKYKHIFGFNEFFSV
jgi:Zn-finger nucleic acid-binding protein